MFNDGFKNGEKENYFESYDNGTNVVIRRYAKYTVLTSTSNLLSHQNRYFIISSDLLTNVYSIIVTNTNNL